MDVCVLWLGLEGTLRGRRSIVLAGKQLRAIHSLQEPFALVTQQISNHNLMDHLL